MIRIILDGLYRICGYAAALCLIGILLLIVIQMLARWTGEVFPGAPDYAGYSMAAASFLAFPYAFNQGAHIRVSLLRNAVKPPFKRYIEIWCLALAALIMGYFSYFAIKAVFWSWKFKDISQGQDATPLWIPQTLMVIGSIVFFIALCDNLWASLTNKENAVSMAEEAKGHE